MTIRFRARGRFLYPLCGASASSDQVIRGRTAQARTTSPVLGLNYDSAVYTFGKEALEGIQFGLIKKGSPVTVDSLMHEWGLDSADVIHDALHFTKGKAEAKFIQGGGKGMLYQPANPNVDPNRMVDVVDLSGVKGLKINRDGERQFAKMWAGAELVLSTQTEEVEWKAVLTDKNAQHAFWSSKRSGSTSAARRNSLVSLDKVLAGAALIESVAPTHKGVEQTHRFYTPVLVDGKLSVIRIVAHEMQGQNPVVDGVAVYDIMKEASTIRDASSAPGADGEASLPVGSKISISQMLSGVKDTEGNAYFQDAAPGESRFSNRAAKDAGPRAGIQFLDDGRGIIHLFRTADASSIIHETGHLLRQLLPAEDQAAIEKWCGDHARKIRQELSAIRQFKFAA